MHLVWYEISNADCVSGCELLTDPPWARWDSQGLVDEGDEGDWSMRGGGTCSSSVLSSSVQPISQWSVVNSSASRVVPWTPGSHWTLMMFHHQAPRRRWPWWLLNKCQKMIRTSRVLQHPAKTRARTGRCLAPLTRRITRIKLPRNTTGCSSAAPHRLRKLYPTLPRKVVFPPL